MIVISLKVRDYLMINESSEKERFDPSTGGTFEQSVKTYFFSFRAYNIVPWTSIVDD